MSLLGRLSLVTGGGSGIGRATCLALAAQGASVAVVDVNQDGSEETCHMIKDQIEDTHVCGFAADVRDRVSVSSLWQQVREEFSHIPSVVVNSAGITRDGFFISMNDDQFDEVIDINLKGTFLVTQIACQQMIQHGAIPGSIINISSISAKIGNLGQANYVASKAAVTGFTKTVAREMAKFNIRANTVVPGFIVTPMTDVVPQQVLGSLKRQIPLGRFGQPEELANVVTFLASPQSSYITGVAIEVAGGLAM